MAQISNNWVTYLTRSYQQIKQSLLDRLVISNPEITDHSETNPLIIILSMFAGVAEMLNLYIDNMCREAFIATCRRFSSIVKLVKLIDYHIKAASPANADLKLTFDNATSGPYTIPVGTTFKSSNNLEYLTTIPIVVPVGSTEIIVTVWQISVNINVVLGTSDGTTPSQLYPLGTNYVMDSLAVSINGISWIRKNTLGYARPTYKYFIVDIDVDGIAYLVFGDGIHGQIPPAFPIVVSYHETLGEPGNIPSDNITTLVSNLIIPGVNSIIVNNEDAASGGSSYESINRIRVSAPLSLRTLDRAVTDQDYVDVAKLARGVGKAAVEFDCGKTIKIYIVPINGGIAHQGLLQTTKAYVDYRKMITTFTELVPAGITRIYIEATVHAKYTQDPVATLNDILSALVAFGSYNNMEINRAIHLSDIIAVIDNLAKVDFLTLTGLSTIPYPRPLKHYTKLSWLPISLTTAVTTDYWILKLTNLATQVQVFKNNVFMGIYNFNTLFTDPGGAIKFKVYNSVLYVDGNEWEFTTYPYKQDLVLTDYTLPTILATDCNITVLPQFTEPI